MINTGFPKQRIPKSKKGTEYGKQAIDSIINNSSFASGNSVDTSRNKNFYLGTLDRADYKYVVNPYNIKKYADKFPAKIRNYNIIKPIVDLLLGEKAKRPRQIQVLNMSPDAIDMKKELEFKEILSSLQQQFLNTLNGLGMETGMGSKEVDAPEQVKAKFSANYKDERAALGQDIYEYLSWFLDLNDKYQIAFKEWLINGKIVTFKEAAFDDVDYDIVPSEEFDHDRSGSLRYIEDGAWAVRRKQMTMSDVVDRFHNDLTEDQIDFLENPNSYQDNDLPSFTLDVLGSNKNSVTDNDRIVNVYHVAFKGLKKLGFLEYQDENGTIQEMEVSEEYKFNEEFGDINIEWKWVNEVYHGYRIDKDIHLPVESFSTQRGSLTNPSKCKLPYNGIVGDTSVVEAGIPYQLLYNIFHFRLEHSISKNKDKILLMEMNTIPKKAGWDADKFMYTADAAGYAFVDSTAENAKGDRVNFNQWSVLDMSLSNYISAQFDLLSAVKNEWEESLGISRQRKGNIMASDGRGTTERSIFQSSVMTEELFRLADALEVREAAGLLATARTAYKDGKKATYILGDYGMKLLEINPEDIDDVDLGIVPVNDYMALENLGTLKSMAMELAQNGTKASTIAELLESKSMSKIKQRLKVVEDQERQWEAEQAKAQGESAQAAQSQALEVQREDREDTQEHDSVENQLDREKDVTIKRMDIENSPQVDTSKDDANHSLDRDKFNSDKTLRSKELNHKITNDNKKLVLEGKKLAKQTSNNSNS